MLAGPLKLRAARGRLDLLGDLPCLGVLAALQEVSDTDTDRSVSSERTCKEWLKSVSKRVDGVRRKRKGSEVQEILVECVRLGKVIHFTITEGDDIRSRDITCHAQANLRRGGRDCETSKTVTEDQTGCKRRSEDKEKGNQNLSPSNSM